MNAANISTMRQLPTFDLQFTNLSTSVIGRYTTDLRLEFGACVTLLVFAQLSERLCVHDSFAQAAAHVEALALLRVRFSLQLHRVGPAALRVHQGQVQVPVEQTQGSCLYI